MRKFPYMLTAFLVLALLLVKCNSDNPAENTDQPASITLFNGVLFYDGYAETVNEPVPEGMIRVQNSRYAKKIPSDFISSLKGNLKMDIIVEAACDNYDRIGSVFLSLINKNEPYDKTRIVTQIEIARFITPFVDKNKSPNEVPYNFEIDNIAKLLKDTEYSGKYDFWMELDIFGVPYAANTQIAGCAGRNDTFFGTVILTSEKSEQFKDQYLMSIASFANFNIYKDTDEIGKTIKSFSLNVTSSVQNAKIYLITSNHGSNNKGEEYNRRYHYIYFDDQLISTYKPGGKSCEPFRQYNTQSNGIYGTKPRTEADWGSWNNWCPGDVIPIRILDLGRLEAGNHTFKIEVPDAKFPNNEGNFPLSAYLQGEK